MKFSDSTQNQAFHALLFFHRHALDEDLGDMADTVRARRGPDTIIATGFDRRDCDDDHHQQGQSSLPLVVREIAWRVCNPVG